MENLETNIKRFIKEAEKKGKNKISINRHRLINDISGGEWSMVGGAFCCIPYITCGRKYYNQTEKNLLIREKEILNKFRDQGYNVTNCFGNIKIKW